jgi:hypothetical protein
MKKIVFIIISLLFFINSAFCQKHNNDSIKLKRWEFGVESGISLNPKPYGSGINNTTNKLGCYLNLGASFFITKWLIINSGIGFYNGSFKFDHTYSDVHYDSIGGTPTITDGTITTNACYFKLFLPVKVLFKVLDYKDKHIIKLGVGFHKEIAFSNKFEQDVYINNDTFHREVLFNNKLNRFLLIHRGDFLYKFSIEYSYRFEKNFKLGVGYNLMTDFRKFYANVFSSGTYNSLFLSVNF